MPDTEYETIEQFIQYWKDTAMHLGMGPNETAISQIPNTIYRETTMPVLSHGDLKPENVIIDEDGNIAAIIDRETFGWYPDFWDPWCYVRACTSNSARAGAMNASGRASAAEIAFTQLFHWIVYRTTVY